MSETITVKLDPKFRKRIMEEPGAEKIYLCLHCTGCTSGCPIADEFGEYNPRRLLRMAALGMKDELLHDETLWYCTTCYNCQERCPMGVKNVDTILKIRTLAVEEGIMLPSHRKVAQIVQKFGHAVPINDDNMAKRKKLGLSEKPETVHTYPDALKEVQTLIQSIGFDRLVAEKKEEEKKKEEAKK